MYSRCLYKLPNAYSRPSALELFKMMSCGSPPNRRHIQADCTHHTRTWEFDVHLVPRADFTGNISTCCFFALLGDSCFSMTGNHIYLTRLVANKICVITTSLRTFTLPIIKVDSLVTKSKKFSYRVQTKTNEESGLEG